MVKDLGEIKSAGAAGVLLREYSLSDAGMLELASAAREIFSDGWLGVHDRAHVALLVDADGVHLGRSSMSSDVVEGISRDRSCLGVSHHVEELKVRSFLGSYRFLAPVFAPRSKPLYGEALGTAVLQEATLKDRTWALGGVTPERVADILSCGVAGVAAIGAIFDGGDVGTSMERLLLCADRAGGCSA